MKGVEPTNQARDHMGQQLFALQDAVAFQLPWPKNLRIHDGFGWAPNMPGNLT